jgi:hypothetical protein
MRFITIGLHNRNILGVSGDKSSMASGRGPIAIYTMANSATCFVAPKIYGCISVGTQLCSFSRVAGSSNDAVSDSLHTTLPITLLRGPDRSHATNGSAAPGSYRGASAPSRPRTRRQRYTYRDSENPVPLATAAETRPQYWCVCLR